MNPMQMLPTPKEMRELDRESRIFRAFQEELRSRDRSVDRRIRDLWIAIWALIVSNIALLWVVISSGR